MQKNIFDTREFIGKDVSCHIITTHTYDLLQTGFSLMRISVYAQYGIDKVEQ